jgi:RNA polymerase sigma-70 factor (ECF subfamily)
MRQVVEDLYRQRAGKILATLVRVLGDFNVVEDVLHEAFEKASDRWATDGVPQNPFAWIVQTARNAAVDRVRRDAKLARLVADLDLLTAEESDLDEPARRLLQDDQLRLIFICCHPAIAYESRVALTLQAVCGLTAEEVGRAFLVPETTMAQRLVRAKQKIRLAEIPYVVPEERELPERIEAVTSVVYLLFNEGYSATVGSAPIRAELCAEAIRLGRLLVAILPRRPELEALLALMLLHDSRRATRVDAEGLPVPLDEQDRGRWDREQVLEGLALVERSLLRGPAGPMGIQAAIAALHARATTPAETDWRQIAALHSLLLRHEPSPVIELNRAVAIALGDDLEEGLRLVERLHRDGSLAGYHLLHLARADILRRLGRVDEAVVALDAALGVVANEADRRYIAKLRDRLRDDR